jgi:hypothetical protein
MKKIYILTAVFALLTLSLNAQTRAIKKVVQPTAPTEKVATPPDGNFRMGPSKTSTTPVTPPYTNDFSTSDLWNWWQVISDSYGNTWTYNSNGYAQYQYSRYYAADDWLVTAPVYLEAGKTYKFYIDAWLRSTTYGYERMEVRMASANTASALSDGTTIVSATNVTSTTSTTFGNENITVSTTGNYYFGIHCISDRNVYYLYVDNLVIDVEEPIHDMKVYMSQPSQVYAGQTATVAAKVTNSGDFDESSYTVTIKANGTTISTQTVNETLAVGASKMIYVQYPTTEAGTVNLTATVACANDAEATNDNATASLSVIAVPAPENVAANASDHNTTVTWEAPNIAPVSVTEDFEDTEKFKPFSIGGISATQHTGAIGGWTVYDSTGKAVWPADDATWPNMGVPQAWIVFNSAEVPVVLEGNSGDQYMESVCPEDGTTTNSWLISPELSGNAQTITFYECVISSSYPETYQVLYSTTDNNPSSFTAIDQFTTSQTSWTLRSVELPDGAKYFAIRDITQNQWLMAIDDITYEVAGEQPVSYNVYLDDNTQPVNVDANTFSNDFSNLTYGSHTCYISAVYAGNIESALVPVTFLNEAKTATPTITYDTSNKGYVIVTATGNGTVTLTVDGQTASSETGTVSIKVVRSLEDRTVTATATALEEGKTASDPATANVPVTALNTEPTAQAKEGLLRLHLLIVDQMKQEIPADNSHPDRYGYVLKYEPNGPGGEGTRESGTVDVRIQKADCEVMGAYTLTEVDNDTIIGRLDEQGNIVHDQGIKMQVITADVAYDLSDSNDMLYEYILQGAKNGLPRYKNDYLTKLRKTQNFTYVEMYEGVPYKGHEFPNGEHHFFEAYNPVTEVFNPDALETGAYATDYMTYAPSVSTWGVQRRYFEDDGLDNTYGAPYWKTAAGQVTMDDSELMAERQKNQWNSVNWTTDAGTASLYILDKVKAVGLLPHTDKATVQYEPYMFRIFVESPSGSLRPYRVVEAVEGSDTEGEHLEALVPDDKLTDAQKYGPISVWESYIEYDKDGNIIGADAENGVMISTGPDKLYTNQTAYTFQKNKVQRDATPEPTEENPHPTKPIWDKDSNNAMFGALNAISPETGKISTDDLKVFVRFYYAVKGELADHTVVRYSAGNRGEGSRSGNGAESGGGSAGAATSVFEIAYHGEVVGQTYYNIQGMESEKPFDGVNIVVTRYSDGSTSVAKIVR